MARRKVTDIATRKTTRGRTSWGAEPFNASIVSALIEAENLANDPLPADRGETAIDWAEISDTHWTHLKAESKERNVAEAIARAVSEKVGYQVKAVKTEKPKNGIRSLKFTAKNGEESFFTGLYRQTENEKPKNPAEKNDKAEAEKAEA